MGHCDMKDEACETDSPNIRQSAPSLCIQLSDMTAARRVDGRARLQHNHTVPNGMTSLCASAAAAAHHIHAATCSKAALAAVEQLPSLLLIATPLLTAPRPLSALQR